MYNVYNINKRKSYSKIYSIEQKVIVTDENLIKRECLSF